MRNESTRTSPVRIFLLGRFEVTREKQRIQANHWTRRKAATNYTYQAARCLNSLAELYQHRDHDGDPAKAQTARSEARQIFWQLGAV